MSAAAEQRKPFPAGSCADPPLPLSPLLALDPDLARLIATWGELPAHIKAAILALLDSAVR